MKRKFNFNKGLCDSVFTKFYGILISWNKQQQCYEDPKWLNNSRGFNEMHWLSFPVFFFPKNHLSYLLKKELLLSNFSGLSSLLSFSE